MIPFPLYLFVLIELSIVAYLDVKFKKIKNYWSLLNIICAVIMFTFFSQHYPFSFEMFHFTLVFIFVGFALFMLKIMGGGDSKFLATFFLLIPLSLQENVFLYLLFATIFIGSITLIKNIIGNWSKLSESIQQKDMEGVKSCFGSKFPYAPVILITWVCLGWELYRV